MAYRPDPTRRNRNLGTAKQGHGKSNELRVPRPWRESVLRWNRGGPHTVVTRSVWGRPLRFLVEHTRRGSYHACTVDDVAEVLNALPGEHVQDVGDIDGLQGIVLRQPTRKEEILRPVWARIGYGVEVDKDVLGPVVFLEAQPVPLTMRWGVHLGPDDQRELERLTSAATSVEQTKRGHTIHFDLGAVRRMQLYHSLLHEVGHWADMLARVELPALDELEEWEVLWDRFFAGPASEREASAHRYAERAAEELRQLGVLPFDRRLDVEALAAEDMRVEDFALGNDP